MKGSDKAVVLGIAMAIILAAFYFKVLGPKRDQASSLKHDVTALNDQIAEQKQVADFGEDARRHFASYYGRLVVLGKAVPADADTASLLVELNSIADRTDVQFDALQLSAGSGGPTETAAPSTTPPSSTSTTTTPTTTTTTTPASGSTAPVAATEATAADLPLGASVGAAGLPTLPYVLTFKGKYFDVADFLKGVDDLVHMRGTDRVAADGRLLTVDGFSLAPSDDSNPSDPTLEVSLNVTSYVTPADQGLTAGATPGGPAAAAGQASVQPASATVSP